MGTYLFLKAVNPLGYVTGELSGGSGSGDAVVTVSGHPLVSPSWGGQYTQAGFLGSVAVTAHLVASGEEGSGSGTIGSKGEVVHVDLSLSPQGPAVVSVSPDNGAQAVPARGTISIGFSKAIFGGTFNGSSVYVKAGTESIAGRFELSGDGQIGSFTPNQDFPSSSRIDVTVTGDVKDISGNSLSPLYQWHFYVKDTTPPEADYAKIKVVMPENGEAAVEIAAGAVASGDTVAIFNDRTVMVADATQAYRLTIAAELSDVLKVSVIDGAGNITDVPEKPLVSVDGNGVLMNTAGGEFVNRTGEGITLEPGSFTEPVSIRLESITNLATVAPFTEEQECLGAFRSDFGGQQALKGVDYSIPAPEGVTDSSRIFLARQIEVFGRTHWMIVDSTKIENGRIVTACWPYLSWWVEMDGLYSFIRDNSTKMMRTFVMHTDPNSVVMMKARATSGPTGGTGTQNKFYIPASDGSVVATVAVNLDVEVVVYEQSTAKTLYSQTLDVSHALGSQVQQCFSRLYRYR